MLIARYTEVLKNLLDNPQTKTLIDSAMSTYPLYTSTSEHLYGSPNIVPTREELNKKILDYYKYREIGFETVGRFIDELEIALNEIMPYYNQLYFSADQDFNVIYNVDYVREINRNRSMEEERGRENTVSNTSSGTSSTSAQDSNNTSSTINNYSKNVTSDTPNGQLSITNQQIDNVDYANEVNWRHDTTSDSATSTGSSSTSGTNTTTASGSESEDINGTTSETEGTIETTKGNYGVVSAQDLIQKYRDIIINIDQQIINDPRISELFMLVY